MHFTDSKSVSSSVKEKSLILSYLKMGNVGYKVCGGIEWNWQAPGKAPRVESDIAYHCLCTTITFFYGGPKAK